MIVSNITTNNSSIQTIKAKVELYNGSTLVKVCTCDDLLQEFTVERVGEDSKFFGFGVSHKININLIDLYRELNTKEINIVKVAYVEQDVEVYPYPTLYVTEVSRDETTNSISITAYDKLYNAEGHTVDELGISAYTLEEFAAACASLLGLEGYVIENAEVFATSYPEGGNFEGTENIRQALTALAEATQTIFYINYENKLAFKKLNKDSQPVLSIDKDKYFELLSEDAVEISQLGRANELGDSTDARLRGYKSGAVVTANDVINESHEVKVSVNSRNLISYPYMEALPVTREGITFSDNGDGGILINGTATGFAQFRLRDGAFLKAEQSYQFGAKTELPTGTITLHIAYYNENGELRYAQNSPFVWKEEYTFQQCYIQMPAGTVCDNVIFYPVMTYGNKHEDTAYTPYVDISYLEVRSYGKNLISYPFVESTKTINGITYTDNGDGSITVNGAPTADYMSIILGNYLPLEDGVTYELTGCDGKLIMRYYNEKGEQAWATGLIKWSKDYTVEFIYAQANIGDSFDNVIWYPMVRKASLDATYEPYNGQLITVNESGSVSGFSAISPNMTIGTNSEYVEIHMEYYRQQDEGATQYVRNNPFWELRDDLADLVDNALGNIYGLSITPFESNWDGNILLEPADKIAFVAEDGSLIVSYLLNDTITFDGTLTQVSSWKYSADEGETASNPTTLGEALAQTFAKVDKANKQITLMVSDIQTTKSDLANLESETDEKINEVNEKTLELSTSLNQTSEDLTIKVESVEKEITENGVSKVKTTTNQYTFDDSGLTVAKSGAETKTTITEEGMTVSDSNDEPLLQAMVSDEVQGVRARDLHATTYLIVGRNSRFEDFGNDRTGCFWIGN